MKKFLALVLTLALISACAPALDAPVTSPPADNSSNGGIVPPQQNWTPPESPYAPSKGDETLQRADVTIDSVDLLIMESYPLQFSVKIVGSLPTPCHQLRVKYDGLDAEDNVRVSVYSVVDPNAVCIQVISPFEIYFPLGSFPSGHYNLIINGSRVAEFDA